MKFYNNRQLCIFLALLEANRPVTSEELSKIAKISVRTVKDEIRVLKELMKDVGLDLVSKSGCGYYLQYEDPEKFHEIRENMFSKYRSASVVPTDFKERVNYIIRRLLTAPGYLKAEDFADGLYVNKRALVREMKEAREMLAYYGIEIETRPGNGMRIKTDEYHLRICMVDYFEFYLHRVQPFFHAEGFLEAFDFDFEERLNIRKVLMQNLISLNIIVPDYCSQKLVIHLILMRSRARRGFRMALSEKDMKQVKKFPEYGYADRIIGELAEHFPDFDLLDEADRVYLALHLAVGRDMLDDAYDIESYAGFYLEATGLCRQITAILKEEYALLPELSPYFKQDLMHILVSLCIKQRFDIKEIQGSPTRTNHIGRNILQSPVCVAVCIRLVEVLEKELKGQVSEYDMLNLAYLIYNLLDFIPLEFEKSNVILIAENSKFAVRSVERNLRRELGDYLNRIDIAEVYELRSMNLEEYDGIFTAHNIPNFLFSMVPVKISYFIGINECDMIFKTIILKKQRWFDELPDLREARIYLNYRIDSVEMILQMLAFKHFKNQKQGEAFQKRWLKYSGQFNLHSYNHILILCSLPGEAGQDGVEIFELEKVLSWKDNVVKYVVYLSMEVREGSSLKILEIVLRTLAKDDFLFQRLLKGKADDLYRDALEKCMLRK